MFDRVKVLGTVMAAGLVIAACGGTTTAPSSAPATQAVGPAASATAPSGQLPKPELTKVRIGLSAPTEPIQFAEKLADMLGIYQKNGLTAEIIGFEGDGKALQALIAGQLDFFVGGASTTVNSVITDTPLKLVSMNGLYITDGFFCGKDIKTAADVKGKTVAVSTFGGTSHGSVLLSLKALGLTAKDVTITQVGGEASRLAALRAGSIGCAPLEIVRKAELTPLGFNVLVDVKASKLPWGRSGLMGRSDFIAKNPNMVLVVVASILEAQNSMWADTKTAAAKFAEFAQIKPEDGAARVNDFLTYGDRSMLFTQEAFIAPRDVLAAVNPAVANVDVTKAMDLSFLNKLKEIGFYQKIGAPTTD